MLSRVEQCSSNEIADPEAHVVCWQTFKPHSHKTRIMANKSGPQSVDIVNLNVQQLSQLNQQLEQVCVVVCVILCVFRVCSCFCICPVCETVVVMYYRSQTWLSFLSNTDASLVTKKPGGQLVIIKHAVWFRLHSVFLLFQNTLAVGKLEQCQYVLLNITH